MSALQFIYNNAITDLNKQKLDLDRLMEKNKDSEVGVFIQRVLDWYFDKDKKHLLWEIFHKAFDLSPILFMGSFGSFVANCLLNNSTFRVEYHKLFVDANFDLVYENGEHKTVLSSKDDPEAAPIVIIDNDGVQQVSLLMEAMDKSEAIAFRRHKENERLQELFKSIRKAIEKNEVSQ